jgi:hypothetical protein
MHDKQMMGMARRLCVFWFRFEHLICLEWLSFFLNGVYGYFRIDACRIWLCSHFQALTCLTMTCPLWYLDEMRLQTTSATCMCGTLRGLIFHWVSCFHEANYLSHGFILYFGACFRFTYVFVLLTDNQISTATACRVCSETSLSVEIVWYRASVCCITVLWRLAQQQQARLILFSPRYVTSSISIFISQV